MVKLDAVQAHMAAMGIDAWLVYDFRGSNQVLARLLGVKKWTTRRVFLLIPARGEPTLLVHQIDASAFRDLNLKLTRYLSWQDLRAWLAGALAPFSGGRIAMEYSAGGILPVVSIVDGGTLESVRACGVEVVSSADLIQVFAAVWSSEAVAVHERVQRQVTTIKDAAFGLIRERTRHGGTVSEREVQQFIVRSFEQGGLEAHEPPIVAANEHSGDPHFEVAAEGSSLIKAGDFVLIDMWTRQPGEENTYADITWVGFVGSAPSRRHQEVFEAVRAARDAAVRLAQTSWTERKRIQGWELDEAARREIIGRGLGDFIKHRTGHSLSPGPLVHGVGMNVDNLETHDTRCMLAGIGFTVEPGVYLPEFGVRLEVDVHVDPVRGPVVTSCVQDQIVTMG